MFGLFSSKKKSPDIVKSNIRLQKYCIILRNDTPHKFEEIVQMIQDVFGKSEEEAYHLVVRLNDRYSCVVDEAHLERAEMLKDRADNYQYPDDYSKPVTCHIERKIDWKG